MEKVLDYISTTKKDEGGQVHVKQEEVQAHNGKKVNVNRIPAKDEYIYGLRLMDVLFTKEEMANSLLLPSKRSDKFPLDKTHVNLMFDLTDKRFGRKWDMSKLTSKCNQKCRDAKNFLDSSSDSDTD